MDAIGRGLRLAGACVGALGVAAVAAHLTIAGVPWLVNVAIIKLVFVAAAGLMASGAVVGRLATRREQELLERSRND